MIFLFLCLIYFTQYDNLQVHPCCCKWLISFFLITEYWSIVYIYMAQFYSLMYRWILKLLPCLGCCKQCCCEHWSALIFLNLSFLHIYVRTNYCYTAIIIGMDAAAAAKSLQLCPILCNPIDGSPPGSLSLGFSRQEYWSGLPFPSPMHACMLSRFSCV